MPWPSSDSDPFGPFGDYFPLAIPGRVLALASERAKKSWEKSKNLAKYSMATAAEMTAAKSVEVGAATAEILAEEMTRRRSCSGRKLTSEEIALAKMVFAGTIDYSIVRMHNGSLIPLADEFGGPDDPVSGKKGAPFPVPEMLKEIHGTAMTPCGEIFWPSKDYRANFALNTSLEVRAWFIHEMGHVWQWQKGVKVAFREAISALTATSPDDTKYGFSIADFKNPPDFNKNFGLEQQCSVFEEYFYRQISTVAKCEHNTGTPIPALVLNTHVQAALGTSK